MRPYLDLKTTTTRVERRGVAATPPITTTNPVQPCLGPLRPSTRNPGSYRALTRELGTRRAGRRCGLPWDPSSEENPCPLCVPAPRPTVATWLARAPCGARASHVAVSYTHLRAHETRHD